MSVSACIPTPRGSLPLGVSLPLFYKEQIMSRGTIYLLHFERPYEHARHYLGFTFNLDQRLEAHRNGRGARLIEVITEAGIGFLVVRTWRGERALERTLKRRKNSPGLCPICRKADTRRQSRTCRTVSKQHQV